MVRSQKSLHLAFSLDEKEEWLAAIVHVSERMGNETYVFLRLGGERVVARAGADFNAEMETAARVRLDMDRADFFDIETGEAVRNRAE